MKVAENFFVSWVLIREAPLPAASPPTLRPLDFGHLSTPSASLVLIEKRIGPIAYDHDYREGICGTTVYTLMVVRTDQTRHRSYNLHMRKFKDSETITIEPWRAAAFPVIKDLIVDRTDFEKILQAGGFISVNNWWCT